MILPLTRICSSLSVIWNGIGLADNTYPFFRFRFLQSVRTKWNFSTLLDHFHLLYLAMTFLHFFNWN
ncbi:hypothetical protein CW304_18840 [Bacillus sp. UFRGS-B20]|nr:hypothetical protein CW304_18840 [Bacillus sp. UFRGS-B20]